MFTKSFEKYACDGDTISCDVDGLTIIARIERDDSSDAPWDREDGHGPVSKWTTRDKQPGERVLHSDRGSHRYYDFAEAVKIAKRDGWDCAPYGQGTPGERAARAAERDFENLKAWCNDEWHYVGIVLSVECDGITLDYHAASLWGIECNYPGSDNLYLTEVANELLDEAVEVGRAAVEKIAKHA